MQHMFAQFLDRLLPGLLDLRHVVGEVCLGQPISFLHITGILRDGWQACELVAQVIFYAQFLVVTEGVVRLRGKVLRSSISICNGLGEVILSTLLCKEALRLCQHFGSMPAHYLIVALLSLQQSISSQALLPLYLDTPVFQLS